MKILVFVKRTIDYTVRVRLDATGQGVQTQGVKMAMNPFDAIALEEALRLKESGHAKEVLVATLGPTSCDETLRTALAMGADRALRIDYHKPTTALGRGRLFKALTIAQGVGLVLMGKQAIDGDDGQTPQALAGLLGWAQGTFASKLTLDGDAHVKVEREVDGGRQLVRLKLPAVISADLRLNEPRFASLRNIMKAKTKPLAVLALADLALKEADLGPIPTATTLSLVPGRKQGAIVENVDALLAKLCEQEGILK